MMSPKKSLPPKISGMAKENFTFQKVTSLLLKDREVVVLAFFFWLSFQVALIALHEVKGHPYFKLTGDPAAIAGAPAWFGFFSQAGLFFWSAAASFCALAYAVLRGHGGKPAPTRFLLATSALSALLLVDDAYLLHEQVLPRFGVPEFIVLFGYVALGSAYLWFFRKLMLGSNYVLLLAAASGLVTSLLSDATHLYLVDQHLFEDSFKLFGTIFWAGYCFSISRSALFISLR